MLPRVLACTRGIEATLPALLSRRASALHAQLVEARSEGFTPGAGGATDHASFLEAVHAMGSRLERMEEAFASVNNFYALAGVRGLRPALDDATVGLVQSQLPAEFNLCQQALAKAELSVGGSRSAKGVEAAARREARRGSRN